MSIYLPNFNDSRVVTFCGSDGVNVDGFYQALLTATSQTSGHISDLWKLFLTNKYGYYNGPHITGYESEDTFSFGGAFTIHNKVSFDGINDWMYYPGGVREPGLIDGRYVTIAFNITPRKAVGTSQTILALQSLNMVIKIHTDNAIRFQFNSGALGGLQLVNGGSVTAPMVTGNSYIYHFSFDCLAAARVVNVFCNGLPAEHNLTFNGVGDTATFTHISNNRTVFGNTNASGTANSPLQADVGFFWMTVGNTVDHYITDPNKFCSPGGHDIALGGDGSEAGVQPVLFFGGEHTAADWNAGTNFGTGGTAYTMNPDGVT
jgi:hypothetical protein